VGGDAVAFRVQLHEKEKGGRARSRNWKVVDKKGTLSQPLARGELSLLHPQGGGEKGEKDLAIVVSPGKGGK